MIAGGKINQKAERNSDSIEQSGLYALHFPFRKRIITEDELLLTKPFFLPGFAPKNKTGILFIHGFTGTPAIWHELASSLAKLGFTISCPVLAGHGNKPRDLLTISRRDWFETVEKSYLELNQSSQQIIIVGHSLGGTLALQLAAKYPTIHKLFLIAPAIYPIFLLRLLEQAKVISLFKKLRINFLPMSIGGHLKKVDAWEIAYPQTPVHALEELYYSMVETQKILTQVENSVTIFQSHHDLLVPPKKASEIISQLGSKQKELIWFDNSYHVIPLDNEADKLKKLILDRL